MLDGLLANHWTQVGIKILAVICGSIAAGIGGAMEGALSVAGVYTLKGLLVIGGASAGGVGGILLIAADRERPGLIADVRRDLEKFREYVDHFDAMKLREDWRADCNTAIGIMLGAIEDIFVTPSGSLPDDLQTVLDIATRPLLVALGIDPNEEDYTLSLFRRDCDSAQMVRVAQVWYDDDDEQSDVRRWEKNQGFTGHAWSSRAMIGVPDALDPHARQIYTRPPDKTFSIGNPEGVRPDEERYRSFACAPIAIGTDPEPWGILTITSDVVARFDADGTDTRGGDNLPTIKIAAALLALVAAAGQENR